MVHFPGQSRAAAGVDDIRDEFGGVVEFGISELVESSGSLSEAIGPVRPLAFEPLLVPKVWGGSRLLDQAARRLNVTNFSSLVPSGEICRIGESWELSGVESQSSRLCQPAEAVGDSHRESTFPRLAASSSMWTLHELWDRFPVALAGREHVEQSTDSGVFPWLIKFLDCKDWLSLQVHPTFVPMEVKLDERLVSGAAKVTAGKFEFWLVMDTLDDGEIIYGPVHESQREQLAQAVEEGATERELLEAGLLARLPLEVGQWVILPPGCVHTVRGVTLLEVQTPVDVTYRIDDYGRRCGDGSLRTLHPRLAAEAIRTGEALPQISHTSLCHQADGHSPMETVSRQITVAADPFQLVCQQIGSAGVALPMHKMTALCVLEGHVELCWNGGREVLRPRDLRLLPVELGEVLVKSPQTPASILLVNPTGDVARVKVPLNPR